MDFLVFSLGFNSSAALYEYCIIENMSILVQLLELSCFLLKQFTFSPGN